MLFDHSSPLTKVTKETRKVHMIKMQRESSPRFLKHHSAPVKSVCFNPKERFQFASGGGDGKVSVCYVSVLVCQAAAITAFLPPFAP